MSWMVPLPVVIPLLAAGLSLAFGRRPKTQQWIAIGALSISLAIAVVLFVAVDDGPITANVGGWIPPIGIVLVIDRLSALMLAVSVAVTLVVLIYSTAQGVADKGEGAPVSVFYPTFLVLSAGVSNAFISGDLFNLYVGFEILLASSFVLITLGGTRERIRAGTIYVVVSLLSSIIFLTALALIYGATGTINMAQLSLRLADVDPGVQMVLHVMLLIAFGIKAAIFPLSAWLPDSYPTAPAPVTAVFAGLLTKVGVYAIIRTETLLFPGGEFSSVLAWVAMATMIIGILGAVAQDDLKRMLSFTLLSHIGFMVWGVAVSTAAGLSAAIFYVAHHITAQTALFLVAGLIEARTGTTSLRRLGSLAKIAPVAAILFFISAMNLSGIPPMTGFLGKAGLISASAAKGDGLSWMLIAGGLITSLLTLYAMVKAWNMAFWMGTEGEKPLLSEKVPRRMTAGAASLVALSLAMAAGAGPLMAYTDRAAYDLRAQRYVTVVLPNGDQVGDIYFDPWSDSEEGSDG
ncbi:multisubunit sodium/proton antiporter, MrpD subunit [Ruaniaceae bacterium KH17]|nr:multisubunit sodium/proton antiporter, MrpD subunit [Ruaniaceae bacterium KH17]